MNIEELISGKHLQHPSTARGIYLDRRSYKRDGAHMRFTYAAPDRWVWLHRDGAPSGAITDGKTHVIVEDGVAALVTKAGQVGTTHRLMSLLNPRRFNWTDTEFGEVVEGQAIGRAAWLVSSTPHQPDNDLVFCKLDGQPMHPDLFSQQFDRMVARSPFPRIRLHDLRHSYATISFKAGVHPKVVSERLGHATVAFTLDRYSHAVPGMQEDAAEKVAGLIFGRPAT